jgi:hypothetical protein
MASHFKWYPAESEIIVPFNARYSFPSQANKAIKMTPRIPPKNAAEFGPGQPIRLEFPAQVGFYLFLKRCSMFSLAVTHSRFSTRLLPRSKSIWFTCGLQSGFDKNASAIRRWTE